ncbi:hypothetical protein llap_6776 [Limosa lapponica baueri]|uniref:Uncharacterized protein n=1 Tax=Limosa lapponica baueri TaxID=1758121 RepID=A0A2I0UA41_LIMLA|nr:hypothetical protein llap_6776 [Limosa lapponica baueri]
MLEKIPTRVIMIIFVSRKPFGKALPYGTSWSGQSPAAALVSVLGQLLEYDRAACAGSLRLKGKEHTLQRVVILKTYYMVAAKREAQVKPQGIERGYSERMGFSELLKTVIWPDPEQGNHTVIYLEIKQSEGRFPTLAKPFKQWVDPQRGDIVESYEVEDIAMLLKEN